MWDVDDVLNWCERRGHKPPYCGCARHAGWVKRRISTRSGMVITVHVDPANGPKIRHQAEASDAGLAWFTSWQDEANRDISPLLHLPELEVIPFPPWPGSQQGHPGHGTWKGWCLTRWAARDGRPFLLYDDDAPAIAEVVASVPPYPVQPYKLVHVDPATALTDEHLAEGAAWLASL